MNTTMADGAEQRLDAQIAEALFGQPGMSKMDVANRVRELRGDGPALLADVQPGGRVRLGDAPTIETQARELLAAEYERCGYGGTAEGIRTGDDCAHDLEAASIRAIVAALSAQPSRGGQDALASLPLYRLADDPNGIRGLHRDETGSWVKLQDVERALAARQPEGATVKDSLTVAARQPVGQITDTEIDARLNALYREMVDSGQHNGGMSGVAWDRAVYRMAASQPVGQTFQDGVTDWMDKCFLPSLYSNMTERGDRLLEEVLELLQAHGYDKARVPTLVDYVFSRPAGDPAQEVGGVMVTLAGYCWVAGLDMHVHGHAELARISDPEVMAKIRAKQEAKNALHFDTPLPGNATAPVQSVDLGPGVKAIAAERERQLQAEGFTRDGDQQYRRGELAKAATAYAQLAAMDLEAGGRDHIAWHGPAAVWPWAPEWWKPVDARRDLVRAGALIAAQIDVLDSKTVGNG